MDGGNIDSELCGMLIDGASSTREQQAHCHFPNQVARSVGDRETIAIFPACNDSLFGPGDNNHSIGKIDQMVARG
jgi:hypothetical protein